jgi:hypothetical protein
MKVAFGRTSRASCFLWHDASLSSLSSSILDNPLTASQTQTVLNEALAAAAAAAATETAAATT